MTLEGPEQETPDPFFDHWAPLLLVQVANAVALLALILIWPILVLTQRAARAG